MAETIVELLTDVADAIREKKGSNEPINAQNFANEIKNLPSGGGDIPVIGDGKTYLYIKIAAEGRMTMPLYFSQSISNGVTIDWGDGSKTETKSGTGKISASHTYAEIGEYVISLNPTSGCTLELGHASGSYCILGGTNFYDAVYRCRLKAVEIGSGATSIRALAFNSCSCLQSVVIPQGVTSIENNAFASCSLSKIVIPDSVTSLGNYSFSGNIALSSVVMPSKLTSIGDYAFRYCYGIAFYDFTKCISVPTLVGTNVFLSIATDCKIIVPDALYDEWIVATNWSVYVDNIVKASEYGN